MSPLSLLYLLLASPMFGSHFDFEHESMPSTWSSKWSNWTPENWTPSNWSPFWPSWTPETPSFFPGSSGRFPESADRINWLLRKAIRSTTSRRSILRELTGVEHTPFTTSTYDHVVIEKLIRNVKIISRIAAKNPELLEAILTCPKTRFALSKVLRTIEPKTLKLVERLVRKTVPKALRGVVAKKLIRSAIHSSPRSFYSTKNIFDNVYSPEHVVMSKVVRRLIKNVAEPRSEYVMKKLIKKALRGNTPFNFNPEMCNVCESVCTGGWSYSTPFSYNLPICKMCTKMCPTTSPFTSSKLIKKVVRKALAKDLIKAVINPFSKSFEHGNTNFCSMCSTVCEPFNWYTTSMTSSFETSSVCNTCNVVCRSERFNTYKMAKKLNKLSRWSSIF